VTHPAKSRWLRSEVTFGPIGRIVCTILLIAPVLFGIFYSVFFLVAGFIWLFIVPLGLRGIWRAVRNPHAPPTLVLPPEPAPPGPGESLHDRRPPQRW
jgi:hypothetical protein